MLINYSVFNKLRRGIHYLTDLNSDIASEEETILQIRKGSSFRGANFWLLVFAILIASIGLNVNSPAVVIGAMLISPLMGPIMGIGLGMGILDLQLIRHSLKHLAIAVTISIGTSSLYFWVTPITEVQSELLARTTPTVFDVLIAVFGGLTGIIAISRDQKSNAIPGVAIATALMPPLCTAGFALANGNWKFFLGAFYLFCINTFFIAITTYFIVRYLKFHNIEYENKVAQRRVKLTVLILSILTIVPSVWMAVQVVQRSWFQRQASQFIEANFTSERIAILNKKVTWTRDSSKIELMIFGDPLTPEEIKQKKVQLKFYDIEEAQLVIHQDVDAKMRQEAATRGMLESFNTKLKSELTHELFVKTEEKLQVAYKEIDSLKNSIEASEATYGEWTQVSKEFKSLFPEYGSLTIAKKGPVEDSLSAYVNYERRLKTTDLGKLKAWLQERLKVKDVEVFQAK